MADASGSWCYSLEDAHRCGCSQGWPRDREGCESKSLGNTVAFPSPRFSQNSQHSTLQPTGEIRGLSLQREGPRDSSLCTDDWAHSKKNGAPYQSSFRDKIWVGFGGWKASQGEGSVWRLVDWALVLSNGSENWKNQGTSDSDWLSEACCG